MILLFGGTSETEPLASALAQAGYAVLVSTATDIELKIGSHPNIRRRCGKLDQAGVEALICSEGIRAVVDAAHPYATQLHHTAQEAAQAAGIAYVRYMRPTVALSQGDEILWARDHDEAARVACELGGCVLLTTGSRNLEPYVREARERGVRLVARVLPEEESLAACRVAGIAAENIIGERGPFTEAENRAVIVKFEVRVLVSKDSGAAGGVPEKLAAAKAEGCQVVLIARPEHTVNCAGSIAEVLARLAQLGAGCA